MAPSTLIRIPLATHLCLLAASALLTSYVCAEDPANGVDFFESRIRPVLVERCDSCHSAKSEKLKGSLRLDYRDGVLKGGETGPAIVPGDPDKSLLIKAIRYTDDDLLMPPKQRLTVQQVADFEKWVRMGAPDPRTDVPAATPAKPSIDFEKAKAFWSFQPVKAVEPPSVNDRAWPRTEIDQFLLAALEAKGIRPVPRADRRTLIRRATYDLIGLPPTPEEIEAFEKDTAPDAFEMVVERLLASPHYGERWGRHWLDVVRYADTAGETADYPVPLAWKYRNYVIDAFNQDKPYDRFIREQIAGDLLAPSGPREKYAEQVVATGYLAISRRFGFDSENYFHLTIEDTIDTLGKSMLGLSIGCSRCHDHKFDPIATQDYYALYGIFSSTRYSFPGSEEKKRSRDMVPLLPPTEVEKLMQPYQASLVTLDSEVKKLETELAALDKNPKPAQPQAAAAAGAVATPDRDKLQTALVEAKKCRDLVVAAPPAIEKAYAVAEGTPMNTKIQRRGDPKNLGDEVPRGFLQILGGQKLPADCKGSGRLDLASWLTDPANPLTARVMVNRIWQYHFGRGLVQTPNDFGNRGRAPTHPQLLDYLALRFVQSGWSIKQMHRLIMHSAAYQLASGDDPKCAAIDHDDDLLWKFRRRRLDAEEIRDSILAACGDLDPTPGTTHPFPAENAWNFTQHAPFTAVYDSNRRSVYLMTQRIKRHPFLALFDGPDPNSTTPERRLTTVPTQALFFMNDPFVHSKASRLAERALKASPTADAPGRIDFLYRTLFGRSATPPERETASVFVKRYEAELAKNGAAAEKTNHDAWAAYIRVLFSSNEYIYLD